MLPHIDPCGYLVDSLAGPTGLKWKGIRNRGPGPLLVFALLLLPGI